MTKKVKIQTRPNKKNEKLLEKAPVEYVFWCHDGSVFADIRELEAGLANMSDETYAYHSNEEKHDFANWVRDIIGDEQLADNLLWAANRLQAAEFVSARLAEFAYV